MFLMSRSGSIGPNVRNGVVLEGANHVRQGVHIAQVGGESSFVQRLLAERRDVSILDAGVHQLLGVVERGQAIETIVGDFGDAEMGLARIAMRALRHLTALSA